MLCVMRRTHSLILSRPNCCNGLYPKAHVWELHRLQMLINTAAHVVTGRSRCDRITDFVKNVLHWRSITQRVHFKMCTLVTLGLAPTYLSDLVVKSMVILRRFDSRSSAHSQLNPGPHRRQFAERAFAVRGPMLWNSLPDAVYDATSLTIFRRLLKGNLYNHRVWKQLVMMVITSSWISCFIGRYINSRSLLLLVVVVVRFVPQHHTLFLIIVHSCECNCRHTILAEILICVVGKIFRCINRIIREYGRIRHTAPNPPILTRSRT